MRIIISLLTLVLVAPPAVADDHDKIVIDLKREWHASGFSPGQTKVAERSSMNLSGEYASFGCDEPGSRASWQYNFGLPIEMTSYPTFVMKYRATNVDTQNTLTCIWINEGKSHAVFPLIDFNKLTVDGQIHEMTIDLPSAPTNSQGTPFESGPINGLLVSVMNTDTGKGTFELASVEFLSNDSPKPQEQDQPIKFTIADDSQHPIKGASVTVDAERKLAAKSATTDENGLATLTPVKNECEKHVVHVEARDFIAIDMDVDNPADDPIQINLPRAMQVGGFVQDEQGKPIKGVTVRAIAQIPVDAQRKIRYSGSITVHTDAQGEWLSPPLPYSDHVYLRLNHPDYATDGAFRDDPAMLDELRSGIATIVLKK
jgi:hypothetical protein